jgi:heme exporter protein B
VTALDRVAAVTSKDLLLEWRGRQTATAMGMVALLIILFLGFVLGSEPARAPAVLWVAMGFAAVLGIPRLTQAEVEQQALETLLLYPGSREHIYWGKFLALVIMLTALLVLLCALVGVLFNIPIWTHLPALIAVGLFGVIGLAAIGTLLAGVVLHVRARELLMPLLLLPLALPVVLGCLRLTEAALAGRGEGVWLVVIGAFDLTALLVCPILFEVVLEES